MRSRVPFVRVFLAFLGAIVFGCTDEANRSAVVDSPTPAGPPPEVRAAPGFGDGPLEGLLSLQPSESATAWSYRVDLDEDGVPDQEGELERPIAFAYRFTEPGVHLVVVVLEGPAGEREEIRVPVVMNDPAAVRVVRETTVEHANPDDPGPFEGVTVGPEGRFVYLGEFREDAIHRLDAATLDVVDVLGDLGTTGLEGLSVTPSGRFLLANFKNGFGFMVVDLDDMEVVRFFEPGFTRGFYVEALDDRLALAGRGAVNVVDFLGGEEIPAPVEGAFLDTAHFALSPNGRLAALVSWGGDAIDLIGLPEFDLLRTIPLPGSVSQGLVAFGPEARTLYVLGKTNRFLALDVDTGHVRTDMVIDETSCNLFCVANPTARSLDGRYVAFETAAGVLFVDTETDLPMYRSPPHSSVAASPVENVFFALGTTGRVRVLEVVP